MRKIISTILTVAMLSSAMPISTPAKAEEVLPYRDTTLSFEERAADLVSRMTLEEKAAQTGRSAPAIKRLGVNSYNYWREGIHGVARQGQATSFPSSLAMSNTWDTDLMYKAMDITGTEARGKNNRYDLSYWNPTINMARDPRWGRNEESYGEDPYLTAQLGASAVKGMQGDDEKYIKVISTLKHFAANNCEGERQSGSSVMTEKTLREYYTKAFEEIVEDANPASVMSSYNAITMSRNGETVTDYIASTANEFLLTDLLRRTWGFSGYVVGDCGAFENLFGKQSIRQKLFPDYDIDDITGEMAVSRAFNAGAELDCGQRAQASTYDSVLQGWMDEETLDRAVYRLFLARMKTGEFDDGAKYQDITSSVIETDEHVAAAKEAAEKSWVLLENKDNTLPLQNTVTNIAVVGNLADEVVLGDYSGQPTKTSSPYEGIASEVKKLNPDAKVELIGNVNDSTPLFNVKSITLVLSDGNTRKIDLSKAENVRGMTLSGSEFKDVTKSGMAVIKDVDFSNVTEIKVEAASMSGMPKASIVIGYSNATQEVAVVDIASTADSSTYTTNTAEYKGASGGYNQTADMYINISASASFSVDNFKTALDAADYIIAYAGTTTADSSESNDRNSIDLPITQSHVQQICDAYPDKAIVVMSTVGQINVESFKDKCKAMLWTSYNGQAQGEALGEILTGAVNPSGKLTTTWYASADLEKMPIGSPKQKINGIDYNFTDYELAQKDNYPGRTYQYYSGDAVYPFGYGTSYTTFEYSDISVDNANADANDTVNVSVKITNTGTVNGTEIAQLYVTVPNGNGKALPLKQIKGFKRVDLNAGESQTVTFPVKIAEVNFFDETAQKNYVINGEYTIKVGASSDDENAQAVNVNVTGTLSDDIKNVYSVPTGIRLIGASDGTTVYPANEIDAQASVALENNEVIMNISALDGAAVTYTSSNESIATVENGTVKAGTKAGTALITVSVTKNNITKTDVFPVVTEITDKVADNVTADYLAKLDAEYASHPQTAYSEESYAEICEIYNNAKIAIANELLEANLPSILKNATDDMDAVPTLGLESTYTIKSVNKGIIKNNKIDYAKDGIGRYTADETSITGTITKNNPAAIELSAFDGENAVDTSKLLWTVEKLDSSSRTAPVINSETGTLTVYENGIFKVTASNYTDLKSGEIIVHANLQIEGESADDGDGATLNDEKDGASNGLCAGSTGDGWLRFDGVKLDKLTDISLRVSNKDGVKNITVSLSKSNDRVIAEAISRPTGAWTSWTTVNARVNRNEIAKLNLDENGCGTIYVQTNGANVDFIELGYIDSDMDAINNADGKVTVSVPFESGVLVEAKYDKNKLISLNTTPVTQVGEYEFGGYDEDEKVSYFLWDGLSTMKPLTGAIHHVYNEPIIKTLTIYRFDDSAFDSFFDTSDGTKLTSGTGMDGIGGWATESKKRTAAYNGTEYTFTRGLKGGRGGETVKNVYFTPDADGVVTVFFDASTDRFIEVKQNGTVLKTQYGTGSGVLTALEVKVSASSPVYIYGGGQNKSIFAVFFDTEKEITEATPMPTSEPTPTPAPLPEITYEQSVEFEDYTKCWPNPESKRITKTAVSDASGNYVIDNTRNNDTFYFGERDMNGLAAIDLVVGTKESGTVTVDFYAVDMTGIDVTSTSQATIDGYLTDANKIGSTVLVSGSGWNDFKTYTIRVNTEKTGNYGLFVKGTTTGKYCGNFDYITLRYADTSVEASSFEDEIIDTFTWNDIKTALVNNGEKTAVMQNVAGDVWTDITPVTFAVTDSDEFKINCAIVIGDQLYLGCDDGLLMTMTPCSKCSTLKKTCGFDITSIDLKDDALILSGNGEAYTVSLTDARVNTISKETALSLAESGAILVDVRTAEEYAEDALNGAINVPLDSFADWITSQSADNTIIVYCSSGKRSSAAAATAWEMGYTNVYYIK